MTRISNKPSFFEGFSPALFHFLRELESNNTKDWFDEHRSRYHAEVLGPIRAFATEVSPIVTVLNEELETEPRVGKTISRINNDIRFQKNRPPYRPYIYVTFSTQGSNWTSGPVLYLGIFSHGISVGFYPGGRNNPKVGPIQEAIRTNSKLFQRYLEQSGIADRYWELAGEQGVSTKWPLPKTARKWASMDNFTIGEYFRCSDPLLPRRTFLDRSQQILIDLYPLWIFAASRNIKEDLDLYQENARALSLPLTKAGD
jgi:uncharacterized protein (TIGR02453 family)